MEPTFNIKASCAYLSDIYKAKNTRKPVND